jgi:hypothetical protein
VAVERGLSYFDGRMETHKSPEKKRQKNADFMVRVFLEYLMVT